MKKILIIFTVLVFLGCKEQVILENANITFVDGVAYHKYDMNLVNGKVRVSYENGQLKNETIYKEGEKISRKEWYNNGTLSYEGNFKDGNEDGVQKAWHLNGQLWYKKIYKYGEEISKKEWYKNGTRKK